MFHVVAFQANLATATLGRLTPIDDDVLQDQNGGFFSNMALKFWGAFLFGADCQYGQVQTPALNCFGYNNLNQIIANTAGNNTNADLLIRDDMPLDLKARELIEIYGLQDSGAAQDITAVALLANHSPSPASGQIITIRGTSTTTATADAWSTLSTTWDVNLPAGQYICVGGRVEGANGYAWRINAQDCEFRPGGLMMSDVALLDNPKMRFGRLGQWCRFDNNLMPKIQVLCSAGTAAFTVYLDIIKIS